MSTTTQNPPVEPPKPERHDEFTGAFGFFRKYQKLILYTAGIFALVTFSITGAMTQWMRGITGGPAGPLATIRVNGKEVAVEAEDRNIGGLLARKFGSLPPTILPPYLAQGADTDLATRLAILRRASIACGLDVSLTEVDRSIDWFVRALNERNKGSLTPVQLAQMRDMGSLAEFRSFVQEGMRIGNYVMLESLGVDASDAAVLHELLKGEGKEKLTCRVATFDMKALEKQLEQKGDVTEESVRTWMEAKTDAEKSRLEVFDTNRVTLLLGIARFDPFDPAQWTEELAGFEFGDEQQKRLYKQEQDRFKDPQGKAKPMDDAEVQARLKKIAQVDEVLNKLLAKLRERLNEVVKAPTEEHTRNLQEKMDSEQMRDAAKKAAEAAPADAALQQALAEAELAFVAKENAVTAAAAALESARKAFDFRAQFAELTKDKAGFEVREVPGPKNAKDLKDLAMVELGEWKMPELATSLRSSGELGAMPARAQHGSFLLQATEVVVRPMKPWDELKTHLQAKYFEEQAKKAGDEKKKLFEEELLRLAKEKLPEAMAAIDQKRQPEIDRLFSEWEKQQNDALQKANEVLAGLGTGTLARSRWEQKKAEVEAALAGRDAKRTQFETEVGKKLEAETKTEAKKKHGEVFEAAATAAGFTVDPKVGPWRRDVRNKEFFDKRYERSVVFLWGGLVNELDAGECTEIVEDTVERRWQMAVCDLVEPLTISDITRREFAEQKRFFDLRQVMTAMQQSYSLDALKARFHYSDPETKPQIGQK